MHKSYFQFIYYCFYLPAHSSINQSIFFFFIHVFFNSMATMIATVMMWAWIPRLVVIFNFPVIIFSAQAGRRTCVNLKKKFKKWMTKFYCFQFLRVKSGTPATAPLSMPHSSLPRTMRKKPSSPQSVFCKKKCCFFCPQM